MLFLFHFEKRGTSSFPIDGYKIRPSVSESLTVGIERSRYSLVLEHAAESQTPLWRFLKKRIASVGPSVSNTVSGGFSASSSRLNSVFVSLFLRLSSPLPLLFGD